MSRPKAREHAMQLLFQMEAQHDFSTAARDRFVEAQKDVDESDRGYLNMIFGDDLEEKLADIDGRINVHSNKWSTVHMPKIDLAIMRLAVCEILYVFDVPGRVAINEAVNLAKKYGDEPSSKFVNGVLGQVLKDIEG